MLVYEARDTTKDSELMRKMARHTLSFKPEKKNKSTGSYTLGCGALHFAVPVMEMPESEPILVGVAEDVKQNRAPARLKPTSEPMPIPKTIPTADRFSWDGMGLDPNAESATIVPLS